MQLLRRPHLSSGYAVSGSTASTLGTGSLITINGGGLGNYANTATVSTPVALNGAAMLGSINLSSPITLGLGCSGAVGLEGISGAASYTGVMTDDAASHPNPLVVVSALQRFTFAPSAGSTYAGGTVVDETGSPTDAHSGNFAGMTVPAAAVLGTGGLTVLPGGKISLAAATNLASGAQIRMISNTAAEAVLALAYSNAVPNLTSNSSGIIGIDAANSAISNEAALGNGAMFLGTVMAAA